MVAIYRFGITSDDSEVKAAYNDDISFDRVTFFYDGGTQYSVNFGPGASNAYYIGYTYIPKPFKRR